MDNIKTAIVNGQVRYSLQLAPGLTVETNNLAEILRFIITYGADNE